MAKKSQKSDDVLDMVMEDRVINALSARISATIMPQFTDMLNEFRESMKCMLREMLTEMFEIRIKPLEEEIRALTVKSESASLRIDSLENEIRQDFLVVHGLPQSTKEEEDLISCAITYFRDDLGQVIDRQDITLAYSLPGRQNKPGPVVLKFARRPDRDRILRARRSSKTVHSSPTTQKYINEFLTKTNSELYGQARSLLKQGKIHSAWTMGGRVFIRFTDKSNERPVRILKPDDFRLT